VSAVEASTDRLVLTAPHTTASLATVRIFAGAAARDRLSSESVEDLKLALSELCAGGIERTDGPGRIEVEIALAPDAIDVTCRGVTALASGPAVSANDASRARVVEALIPDAAWSVDGDRQVVRFRLSDEAATGSV